MHNKLKTKLNRMDKTLNKHEAATDVYTVLANRLCFRAWVESQKFMAIQGTPDLETLQSFMFHYADEKISNAIHWVKRCERK